MGTIRDKLVRLLNTKERIKGAIISKGQPVSDSDTFDSYANKILAISTEVTPIIEPLNVRSNGTYYASSDIDGYSPVMVNVPTGPSVEQATPSITVSSNGLITASATQAAGLVSAGTKSATKQLTILGAQTVVPSTSAQTVVASGTYTTGDVKVAAMPTATQATPSISISSSGLITASATQSAGYVSAGTKSGTKQLTTKASQTIIPGTTDKTIASGIYLTGTQTILGDTNLKTENIRSGTSIFGVPGGYEGGVKFYTGRVRSTSSKILSITTDFTPKYVMGIHYDTMTTDDGTNNYEVMAFYADSSRSSSFDYSQGWFNYDTTDWAACEFETDNSATISWNVDGITITLPSTNNDHWLNSYIVYVFG